MRGVGWGVYLIAHSEREIASVVESGMTWAWAAAHTIRVKQKASGCVGMMGS